MNSINFGWAGDSTQVGRVLQPGDTELTVSAWNECDFATSLLNERFGAGSAHSVNWSMGGTNSVQWCNGDPSIAFPSMAARIALPANASIDVVIFKIGINDAFNSAITQSVFRWCIQKICTDVRAAGKRVVLQTPCPIDKAGFTARLWDMQNSIKVVAAAMTPPVQVIDHYGVTLAGASGWQCLLSDGIHPTDALYRWNANTTFCALIPHYL